MYYCEKSMGKLKLVKKVSLHILVSPELDRALTEASLRERRTKTEIAEEALRKYLGLPPESQSEEAQSE
ncbi:putative regulatory protein [Sulfolobales Mexican fusellovirus 1]|uniref:putative regulatory protein n=1 Tax=Sulfolobales Mexican fusellovirus 1 TaxID=1298531 RepID=UPI0002C12FA7|nr:putative regulatory protein [Sulfolobales Mexican fusellovirus 1]AGG36557.1 putative regulatory protein [Sulfolobales Mexican fusellovirus 1]